MVANGSLDPETVGAKIEQIAASLEPVFRALEQRKHSVQAALLSAYFQRALELIRLTSLLAFHKITYEEYSAKTEPLSELKELSTWLVDPENGPSSSEIRTDIDLWMRSYVDAGLHGAAEFAERLRKAWLAKPKGHPIERRRAAVRALETKLANPKLSWKELAERFYPSEKGANIDSPGQALRQEVIVLRKLLKKCGIAGWEPFQRYPRSGQKAKKRPRGASREVCQE